MQKYAMFVKNRSKINMLKIRNLVKLEIMVIMQVNIKVLHITCLI